MNAIPPPILPQPEGWRQPGLPWAPGELVVAGLAISVVGAWGALQLMAYAWNACDHVSPGASFGLLFVVFPMLVIGMWIIFCAGLVITSKQRGLVRLGAGAALAIAAVFFLVTVLVPDSRPGDYRHVDRSEYPECGPAGVPTWWPAWLPS